MARLLGGGHGLCSDGSGVYSGCPRGQMRSRGGGTGGEWAWRPGQGSASMLGLILLAFFCLNSGLCRGLREVTAAEPAEAAAASSVHGALGESPDEARGAWRVAAGSETDDVVGEADFRAEDQRQKLPGRTILQAKPIDGKGYKRRLRAAKKSSGEVPWLSIYSAPMPFEGAVGQQQMAAIKSWLKLDPKPKVFLMGSHPSFWAAAEAFSGAVFVDNFVDQNMFGQVLVGSLFSRAAESASRYSAVVRPTTILPKKLMDAIRAAVWSVDQSFMLVLPDCSPGSSEKISKLFDSASGLKGQGSEADETSVAAWAWQNTADRGALLTKTFLPLPYGSVLTDHWLAAHIAVEGRHAIIDGSEATVCGQAKKVRLGKASSGMASGGRSLLEVRRERDEGEGVGGGEGTRRQDGQAGLVHPNQHEPEERLDPHLLLSFILVPLGLVATLVLLKRLPTRFALLLVLLILALSHFFHPLSSVCSLSGSPQPWLLKVSSDSRPSPTSSSLSPHFSSNPLALIASSSSSSFSPAISPHGSRHRWWSTAASIRLILDQAKEGTPLASGAGSRQRVLRLEHCSSNGRAAGRGNPKNDFCARPTDCPSSSSTSTSPKSPLPWACGITFLSTLQAAAEREEKLQLSGDGQNGLPRPELQELLPLVADSNKVVILVAASMLYSEMLLHFVCNLRRLNISLPLVAALDDDVERFAFLHGLPVFRMDLPGEKGKPKDEPCRFGSHCFRALSKVKSRAVLKVLKMGYHVLWSDVDIVWFQNPLPDLLFFGEGFFPVQSDSPWPKAGGNGKGHPIKNPYNHINSGFYFARSEAKVVEAFEAIIAHSANSLNTTEQPSFFRVLCGPQGETIMGSDGCIWKNGLKVVFLNRMRYANGRTYYFWKKKVKKMCQVNNCAIVHCNWLSGIKFKKDRLIRQGVWYLDPEAGTCRYNY